MTGCVRYKFLRILNYLSLTNFLWIVHTISNMSRHGVERKYILKGDARLLGIHNLLSFGQFLSVLRTFSILNVLLEPEGYLAIFHFTKQMENFSYNP